MKQGSSVRRVCESSVTLLGVPRSVSSARLRTRTTDMESIKNEEVIIAFTSGLRSTIKESRRAERALHFIEDSIIDERGDEIIRLQAKVLLGRKSQLLQNKEEEDLSKDIKRWRDLQLGIIPSSLGTTSSAHCVVMGQEVSMVKIPAVESGSKIDVGTNTEPDIGATVKVNQGVNQETNQGAQASRTEQEILPDMEREIILGMQEVEARTEQVMREVASIEVEAETVVRAEIEIAREKERKQERERMGSKMNAGAELGKSYTRTTEGVRGGMLSGMGVGIGMRAGMGGGAGMGIGTGARNTSEAIVAAAARVIAMKAARIRLGVTETSGESKASEPKRSRMANPKVLVGPINVGTGALSTSTLEGGKSRSNLKSITSLAQGTQKRKGYNVNVNYDNGNDNSITGAVCRTDSRINNTTEAGTVARR